MGSSWFVLGWRCGNATATRMPPSTTVLARRLTAQACAGARPSSTRAAFVKETTRPVRDAPTDACNFDANATLDNESCEYDSCAGCTDALACNFDASVTLDNGSCECPSRDASMRTRATSTRMPPSTTVLARRLTAQACAGARPSSTRAAFVKETTRPCGRFTRCGNFDPNASLDNGSCEYEGNQVDALGVCGGNYEANATIDDGSCDDSCFGCLDEDACNYEALATIEDGSCDYESCVGCIDPNACNYNPDATMDEAWCLLTCTGALSGDGNGNNADFSDILDQRHGQCRV